MRVEGLEPPRPRATRTQTSRVCQFRHTRSLARTCACGGTGLYGPPVMAERTTDDDGRDVVIEHPNREKASSKATKAVVILLLLVSVVLMLIVTIGGWDALEGAKPVQVGYILLYLVMAFFVARWNRGVLPVAAALAIILLIFAAVATPEWFD